MEPVCSELWLFWNNSSDVSLSAREANRGVTTTGDSERSKPSSACL